MLKTDVQVSLSLHVSALFLHVGFIPRQALSTELPRKLQTYIPSASSLVVGRLPVHMSFITFEPT